MKLNNLENRFKVPTILDYPCEFEGEICFLCDNKVKFTISGRAKTKDLCHAKNKTQYFKLVLSNKLIWQCGQAFGRAWFWAEANIVYDLSKQELLTNCLWFILTRTFKSWQDIKNLHSNHLDNNNRQATLKILRYDNHIINLADIWLVGPSHKVRINLSRSNAMTFY